MTQPVVSVIMNCRNCAKFLIEAIDSVYSQTYKSWEIIFFDNNSDDGSAAIVGGYDSRLRYFFINETLPLGAARNRAIKEARGEFLAFLDCDDIWAVTKLEKQVATIRQPGSGRPCTFCYTDAMRIDESGKHITPYSRERSLLHGNVYIKLMSDCFIAMSSCMVVRKICMELGGFDECLQHVEEWDLWLRIASLYDLALVPECLTKIRFHGGNISRNYKTQEREIYNMLLKIDGTPDVERERNYAMKWFAVRFSLIDAAHEVKIGCWRGAKAGLRLLWMVILHPLIGIRILRMYFKPDLVRLYRIKYLGN